MNTKYVPCDDCYYSVKDFWIKCHNCYDTKNHIKDNYISSSRFESEFIDQKYPFTLKININAKTQIEIITQLQTYLQEQFQVQFVRIIMERYLNPAQKGVSNYADYMGERLTALVFQLQQAKDENKKLKTQNELLEQDYHNLWLENERLSKPLKRTSPQDMPYHDRCVQLERELKEYKTGWNVSQTTINERNNLIDSIRRENRALYEEIDRLHQEKLKLNKTISELEGFL